MSEIPELGDWHQKRRCVACGETIDARAVVCYLCGETPTHEANNAAVRAAEAERLNGHLYGEGNAAMRDHAATRNIPTGNMNGKVGPAGAAYQGARGRDTLYKHIRQQLREATGA